MKSRFRRLFPSGEAEPFFASLDEARAELEAAEGPARARSWHRRQLLRSLPGLAADSVAWRLHMLASDLKVARRSLAKHKAYTLITTAGLAAGAAACLLISLYVKHELGYDAYHKDGSRVFRLLVTSSFSKGKPSASMSELAAPALKSDFPEVEQAARLLRTFRQPLVKREDKAFAEDRLPYADSELFDVLTIPFARGRREGALSRPNTMVITASLAERYFGARDPLGETLDVDGVPTEVTGLVEDPPSNSHLKYRGFLSYRTLEAKNRVPDWQRYDPHTYLKLRPGTDLEAFAAKVARLSEPYLGQGISGRLLQEYSLQPVRAIHLDSRVEGNIEPTGNTQTLLLLSALALIILGLAVLNFVNLATARSAGRAKEVGVRKALGAERPRLVRQFMAESFLVTLASFGAGLLLAAAALGPFNRFAGMSFVPADLVRPAFLPVELGLLLLTGFAAGLYPALVLSSFSPAAVMRRDPSIRLKGGTLRRVFVVGQFAVAVALMAVTLGMARQVRYMRNAPLGFDKEQKLVAVFPGGRGSLPSGVPAERQATVKATLAGHPGVRSATLSSSVPGRGFFYNGTRLPGQDRKESKTVRYLFADGGFLRDYRIELAAGRAILPGGAGREVLLNETAMRLFDWATPTSAIGQKLDTGVSGVCEIVGVVRDFHQEGLQALINPLVIGQGAARYHMVTLTFDAGQTAGVLERLRKTWAALVPGKPLEYFFLDDDFARQYAKEERTTALFSVFAGLGIIVACLGLVGLASFLAEKRTKEIGVRKVLGATVPGILGLLGREFAVAVVIANVLAWPAAWFVVHRWLEGFAFRSAPTVGTFLIAGLLALTMAMLSVGWKSVRAARANPVESLRYE
jgi:putative ABC transport system permease protein